MSNVLIGIIGVILFIGLALAGALILGDDFKSSRSTSSAAAITGQLQQISSAIAMYQLKTGQPMLASAGSTNIATLIPRFLKSAPVNPIKASNPFYTAAAGGSISTAVPVQQIFTLLGGTDDAKNVCMAIEEQAGRSDPVASMAAETNWATAVADRNTVGCFYFGPSTTYVAFIRT